MKSVFEWVRETLRSREAHVDRIPASWSQDRPAGGFVTGSKLSLLYITYLLSVDVTKTWQYSRLIPRYSHYYNSIKLSFILLCDKESITCTLKYMFLYYRNIIKSFLVALKKPLALLPSHGSFLLLIPHVQFKLILLFLPPSKPWKDLMCLLAVSIFSWAFISSRSFCFLQRLLWFRWKHQMPIPSGSYYRILRLACLARCNAGVDCNACWVASWSLLSIFLTSIPSAKSKSSLLSSPNLCV